MVCFRLALMSILVGSRLLLAEDTPPEPTALPGAVGQATVRLELLGRGLVPTARVVIINPTVLRLRLSRAWTYEVVPQTAINDERMRTRLPALTDTRLFATDELHFAPEQRVWLTLPERRVFGRSNLDPIEIASRKSWGHDHDLDLRPAHLLPGPVFVRLNLRTGITVNESKELNSDWQRIMIPDVPALPLIRFTTDSRKLSSDTTFARAEKEAGRSFTAKAESGEHGWTRILTLDPTDPLAGKLPKLLLDGRSQHVFGDGIRCKFAVRGISADGVVDTDADVLAVMPLD